MQTSLPASLRRLSFLAFAALATGRLAAQESTVVLPDYVTTATRTPAALTTLGTAVESISAAELARMQVLGLNYALAGIPGAPSAASGAPGGVTSLFLRGSNSNQTLFLVDGIRANDPNTDYQATLGGLCLGACDNLEVSHGPQSTLYGGEAVGGVIAIRGQRGRGARRGSVALEAGSFGTIQGAASVQAGDEQGGYTFSLSGGHTDNERANNAFDSASYALRVDRRVSAKVAVGATWRGFIGAYGSPGPAIGWGANDPDNEERESNQLATVFAEFTPAPGFSSKAVLGGQDRRYESFNGTSTTLVKNRRAVLDWQATWTANEAHRVTGGVTAEANHTRNTGFGDINRRQKLLALFVQDEWSPLTNVFLTAGLRSDDHDSFGRATTGKATAAWLSPGSRWKVRASYGTAFRSPSFLDLYGQSSYYVGNPDLEPEKAKGWDAGVDYFFADKQGMLSLTWFDTRISNLVTFDFAAFPSTVQNVGRARTRGLELSGKFTLPGAVEVRVAGAHLDADDVTNGTRLLRRPRLSGSLDVWKRFGAFSAGTGLVVVSDRMDVDAVTFATIAGEDYTVMRVYGAWQASERVTLKARVENLLDEKYDQVHGYPQPGLGAYAGVEWKF
ncbi:Vitamin B12 transporter BtuB precursor [Lacunisphaera limnophila]|uniref:Vitamin B12 transporter BtuB n=1 Tax=Lacunisphaera limnophila TaxID=1838286 RepID=A0A1I7PHN0_9BACT|nr:TonB-dependent receptor [Lacunisphaera limnophila]AOS43118.1 Vitamin B12 transporter BtuB precursor [Lacunisphaera limnophila]